MPETPQQYWYRLCFRLKMMLANGTAFQHLFNDVMLASFPTYEPIAPWGNWGDGGNDGWLPDEGHYFQLYGPQPNTTWTPNDVVKKAADDLAKLPEKWANVRKYTFVLNDKYQGIPGPVSTAVNGFQSTFGLTTSNCIGSGRLTEMFLALSDDKKNGIIDGGLPRINNISSR